MWTIRCRWDEKQHLASCTALPEYLDAVLTFNFKRIRAELRADFELEEICLHELVHCVLWGLAAGLVKQGPKELATYLDEYTTTVVTQGLLNSRNMGLRSPKRGIKR